jgi:hypothetical protein
MYVLLQILTSGCRLHVVKDLGEGPYGVEPGKWMGLESLGVPVPVVPCSLSLSMSLFAEVTGPHMHVVAEC